MPVADIQEMQRRPHLYSMIRVYTYSKAIKSIQIFILENLLRGKFVRLNVLRSFLLNVQLCNKKNGVINYGLIVP